MKLMYGLLAAAFILPAFSACQPGKRDGRGETAINEDAPPADALAESSAQGKPAAPIDIGYHVIGSAFVGQPVSIEIDVSSSVRDRSIALEYRINDPRDLSFAEAQPQRVSLSAIGDAPSASRQVTIVPQREGRLYLNVSAEIETEEGSLIKAISIPVEVGAAREEGTSGEPKEDADGEPVTSMPAEENKTFFAATTQSCSAKASEKTALSLCLPTPHYFA